MGQVTVVVRFAFEGIHSWPDAPPELNEAYLRHPHRHMFHVEAAKAVTHLNRDVEIIALRRDMEAHCQWAFAGPHHKSCELMAAELLSHFELVRCQVLEDGENGAEVRA